MADTKDMMHKQRTPTSAGLPGDTLHIYQTMKARTDELDAQVIARIRQSWTSETKRLAGTALLGDWYLGEQAGEWLQLCVVRIYFTDPAGEMHSILREYAIPFRGGLPRLAVLDGFS